MIYQSQSHHSIMITIVVYNRILDIKCLANPALQNNYNCSFLFSIFQRETFFRRRDKTVLREKWRRHRRRWRCRLLTHFASHLASCLNDVSLESFILYIVLNKSLNERLFENVTYRRRLNDAPNSVIQRPINEPDDFSKSN